MNTAIDTAAAPSRTALLRQLAQALIRDHDGVVAPGRVIAAVTVTGIALRTAREDDAATWIEACESLARRRLAWELGS